MTTRPRLAYNALVLRKAYSGVEYTIHGFLHAWAKYGPEPLRVFAPARTPLSLPQTSPVLSVCPVRLPYASRAARIAWEQVWLPQRLRQERVALVHAPAYIAPLAAPCPVILTIHDLHVYTHPPCCTFENRLYYRLFLPSSLRRAAAIIVYSEHVRHTVAARFPACAARIAVIAPGVDPSFVPVMDSIRLDSVRAAWRLPPRFILFVGDLAPRKNLPRLLEAFSRLVPQKPDLHLVLAGTPDRRHPPLDRLYQRWGLLGRVRQLGYIPGSDLPALYSLAEVLAFPSLDEGFGLPALEALACGCPVVCTPGGAAEICGPAAVCCDPLSVDSIAEALLQQLNSPVSRAQRAKMGFSRLERYSWATHVAATADLYRRVLDGVCPARE